MNVLNRLDTVGPAGKAEAAARLRERAGALFGAPGAADAETGVEPVPAAGPERVPGPEPARGTVPGVAVFAGGRLGRLRQWLFVRCGLDVRAVLALGVVLVVAVGLAVHRYWADRPRAVPVPPRAAAPLRTPAAAPAPPAKTSAVTVDVAGKVAAPGLRRLPGGARVADALAAAGGPLPGTDTTALNLARRVVDGEQILVGVTPPPGPAPGPADPAHPDAGAPVGLSSATAAQLDALPGVGPVLAQHIIEFRTRHGGFTSVGQLREIPGIGPRKFATLQPLVQP